MKSIIFVAILVCISGCTPQYNAETTVLCPCTVSYIRKQKPDVFRVGFKSDHLNGGYFSILTTSTYTIGDTLK